MTIVTSNQVYCPITEPDFPHLGFKVLRARPKRFVCLDLSREDTRMKEEDTFTIEDELNDDWLRASRLKKRAKQGDKEAKRELERMEQTKLVKYDEVTRNRKTK